MNYALLHAQFEFVFSNDKFPAIVGGLGCVHPSTKIWTECGLMRICDINHPMRVLSWNEKNQRFQLSLSGGSFPKGRANLYRIESHNAVFQASGHHQLFSSDCKYLPVESLKAGSHVMKAKKGLLSTILEHCLLLSPLNDPHSSQKYVDLMGSYADGSRRYGLQLLSEEETCLIFLQEQGDVQELFHTSGILAFLRTGGLAARKLLNIRPGQFAARAQKKGYFYQCAGLAEALVSQALTWSFVHILQIRLKLAQFLVTCANHCKADEWRFPCEALSFLLAYINPVCINKDAIISCVDSGVESIYYDMQVLETNNYICENGFIHHNSGKSRAGTLRLVTKLAHNPGLNGAYYMPTYDLINLRAIPGVEQDLELLNIKYATNKSQYKIHLHNAGDIIFRSYDNPNRIIAYEVAHSICDELDTLPKEKAAVVWRKISERNRQLCTGENTIGLVTTPDQGVNGFVYEKWVKKQQDGYKLYKASTRDNKHLPAGYVQQILDNYDPVLASLYLDGEFVSLNKNKVYHFYDRNNNKTSRDINNTDHLHIGIDFNIGGCVAIVCIISGNEVLVVDEFVSYDTRDFVNNLTRYRHNQITIYPDASGRAGKTSASESDISIIERAGFFVLCHNTNPAVRDRINAVNGLLAHNKLLVNDIKCFELASALETQGYNEKGEPEKYGHHPAVDDYVDALGYIISYNFPIRGLLSKMNIFGL